jgi:hypothetical protein
MRFDTTCASSSRTFGYQDFLSEFSSFPIDPNSTTIDNCLRNVRDHADIFVLIIGTRYGSTDEHGRSITNLEYSQARAKGIPIYAFVQSDALAQLPVWKANPTITFPGVDSSRVFEFISEVRSTDGVWVYAFQNVDDITATLRNQWAYLFHDSLRARLRLYSVALPESLRSLTGDALRCVVDRPSFWEYRLFLAVLDEVFQRARPMRLDWEMGLSLGHVEVVDAQEAFGLLESRMEGVLHTLEVFNKLFSQETQVTAFGPPGVAGDPERIVHFARRVGDVYVSLIDWSLGLRRVRTVPEVQPVVDHVATGTQQAIGEFERFHRTFSDSMASLIKDPPKEGETRHIKLDLTLEMPASFNETHERLLREAAAKLGISPY